MTKNFIKILNVIIFFLNNKIYICLIGIKVEDVQKVYDEDEIKEMNQNSILEILPNNKQKFAENEQVQL